MAGTTSLESGSVSARRIVFPAVGPLACLAHASSPNSGRTWATLVRALSVTT